MLPPVQTPDAPVSLAELTEAGICLRPEEAATLVRELILQVVRGAVAGVPSPHVIRLSSSGSLSVEGPVAAGGQPVVRAAQLLDALLPQSGCGSQGRVPGSLKLVLARGLGTLDLPPFASLAAFADELSRFASPDPAAIVASLVAGREATIAARPDAGPRRGTAPPTRVAGIGRFAPAEHASPPASVTSGMLTISDIRRARRATGRSLREVAEQSRIPVGLLRQLEWGYLLNWPAGPPGRAQLTRYARAAGLDAQLVSATVVPLLEQTAALRTLFARHDARPESAHPIENLVPHPGPGPGDVPLDGHVPARVTRSDAPARRRSDARAVLAMAALLLLAVLPAWWAYSSGRLVGRWPLPAPAEFGPLAEHVEPSDAPAVDSGEPAPVEQAAPPVEQAAPPVQTGQPAETQSTPIQSIEPSTPLPPAGSTADAEQATRALEEPEAPAGPPPAPTAGRAPYAPPVSVGTAMFHEAKAGEAVPAAEGSSGRGVSNAVLRVTRIVGDHANNSPVRPSPDGRHIAFDSDRDGERGVYVADADGRNVQRVSPAGFAAMPSWSPDGRVLAFVRAEAGEPDVWNLWTLELETGSLQRVTSHPQGQPWGASWFPEGRRLVYSLDDRLVIHDLQGGKDRVVPSPRKGRHVRTPVVSPEGSRVVFHVQGDGVWLLNVADGSVQRVLDDPTADEYAWSPDGRQIAYHSDRSGGWGVWVVTGPRRADF